MRPHSTGTRTCARSEVVHTDTAIEMTGQAEPGGAPRQGLQHVARAGRGEAGGAACRGLGRQHRRADGDGQARSCDHAGIERRRSRRSGRREKRVHRARRRRQHRRHRPSTLGFRADGRRHGARLVPCRAADRGLLNVGVEEIKGAEEVKRRTPG